MKKRFSILREAEANVRRKEKHYAPPEINMARIAKLWSVRLEKEITPEQVADCMILMKVARSMNGYKKDNQIDIAGYAQVKEEVCKK